MPSNIARDAVTEPLLPAPAAEVGSKEPTHTTQQQPQSSDEPGAASGLPSQSGTIKVLALVLVVVALLVTAAALLSKSGVVQPGGPPPKCRKSASLAVLRQEEAAPSANTLASTPGLLQLIVWGGKGKKAELVFNDSHLLNLQDRKWRSVRQKAGLLLKGLGSMPGLRNIWKSSQSQQALHTDPAQLPAARWKQLSVTDPDASSMVVFGGDGLDAGYKTSSNGHNYFNDAWQVSLDNGKARWQNLWNTGPSDSAPEPRRAAAGALFTITNTTSKQLLIHGGRLAAGHILGDLWQARLGAGNITYQQLWPPQQQALQKKKKGKKGKKPFGPAARKGHAAVAVEDPDACLVIFGGRSDIDYFNDVWAYRLSTATWEDWTPVTADSAAPLGRDHFGAVYNAGHMYIYGGRGGSSYGQSKALDDVWHFTVASRSWTQLTTSGRAPLPRFLFSYDIIFPLLHHSSTYKEAAQKSNRPDAEHVDTASKASSELHTAPEVAPDAAVLEVADAYHIHDSASMPVDSAFTEVHATAGPPGSMIVFGGESIDGCYLDDVWVLHLNSLSWEELSRPVACQKRCRSLLDQN